LEYHSNVIGDVNDNDENQDGSTVQQKLKLAKDYWDSPIIYAKGSRNGRRFHNLCESVFIFD
jgi:CRISPR-associated endonuclease/helicase Cas3